MYGTPIQVAIALGLLTAEISEEPWRNALITFSQTPAFHWVEGNVTLKEKVQSVMRMDWMMNTDLQLVFDMLLKRAIDKKVPPENMIKQLFIFSDMEFDQACPQFKGATDLYLIQQKYALAGYPMPKIVFWNLRASGSKPAVSDEENVAMLSGFSGHLLSAFLDGRLEDFTPKGVMLSTLMDKRYDGLVVVD
mmetsp:Transcript_12620/g.36663  ORF Transcript_12620/g.36663 Transcript_12620/m.36663 type:complete len:192 (+) Transcript_12620:1691-2266(+)